MTKTNRYVECSAAGMKYRLIPVTDEIIRCMIAKDEVKTEQESLIIEKKEYPQVPFEAAEADGAVTVKTSAVQAELNLKTGGITWKHADGSVWLEQNKADLTTSFLRRRMAYAGSARDTHGHSGVLWSLPENRYLVFLRFPAGFFRKHHRAPDLLRSLVHGLQNTGGPPVPLRENRLFRQARSPHGEVS